MKKTLLNIIFAIIAVNSLFSQRIEPKILPAILENTESLEITYNYYIKALNSEINSEYDLMNIFALRDSLLTSLDYFMEDYYYTIDFDENPDGWSAIEKELSSIGFKVIYAEGMYAGMNVYNVLDKEVEKFGSEPMKIMLEFKYKVSETIGGEYPFDYLYGYYEAVLIGEKLLKDYKETIYFKEIRENFKNCLFTTTDLHTVNGNENCFFSEFWHQKYPFMSECESMKKFIKEHEESYFQPLYLSIIGSMSNFETSPEYDDFIADAYVIITDKVENYEEGREVIFNYFLEGIDIIHNIQVVNDKKTEHYVAYRFYSDKNKAEIALKTIQKAKPAAFILHVLIPEGFEPAVVDNEK